MIVNSRIAIVRVREFSEDIGRSFGNVGPSPPRIVKISTKIQFYKSRSMKSRSFHLESKNIRGEPLIVRCRSSNSLSCEIEVCPTSSERSFLLSFLVVVVGACVTLWISDVQPTHSAWISVSCLLSVITLWIKYNYYDVIKESVTVVKNIGIQIKTTYKTGRQAVQFVDHKSVADIIINEAITMHKVIFYVAILTRNSENKKEALQLLPLFTSFYPRLEGLKPIYHSIRSIIFNDCDQEESWPDRFITNPNNIS